MSDINNVQQYSLKLPEPTEPLPPRLTVESANGVVSLSAVREAQILEKIEDRVRRAGVFAV